MTLYHGIATNFIIISIINIIILIIITIMTVAVTLLVITNATTGVNATRIMAVVHGVVAVVIETSVMGNVGRRLVNGVPGTPACLVLLGHPGRLRVQLHKRFPKLVVREEGFKESLEHHVGQPLVEGGLLEEVENQKHSLTSGLRIDEVLQLVRHRAVQLRLAHHTSSHLVVVAATRSFRSESASRPESLLEETQVESDVVRRGVTGHALGDLAVDAVSEHGLDDLLQNAHNAPAQPLIAVLKVEDLVHEEECDVQRNAVLTHLKVQRRSYLR